MIRHQHFDRFNLAKAGRLEDTPQGYLWCRDVPLARTGMMEYAPHEVPDIPLASGRNVVVVERTADEVFSAESVASFRGMPLTNDHPDDFVFAHNHRQHRIGDIHDPRRGRGEHHDCLVADLLVTDPSAIALIKSKKKRELSCGYDASYTDVRPGYGRQINIRGNHVSLVDAGRAGSRIAIKDHLMSKGHLDAARVAAHAADAVDKALAPIWGQIDDLNRKLDRVKAHRDAVREAERTAPPPHGHVRDAISGEIRRRTMRDVAAAHNAAYGRDPEGRRPGEPGYMFDAAALMKAGASINEINAAYWGRKP